MVDRLLNSCELHPNATEQVLKDVAVAAWYGVSLISHVAPAPVSRKIDTMKAIEGPLSTRRHQKRSV